MKSIIYLVFVFLLLSGCSPKKENPQVEDYGSMQEEKASTSVPLAKVEAEALKNTATFHTVLIKQMKFEPTELKLHNGDTVLWINKDITDHDITEEVSKKWSSSKIPVNKSWSMVVKESADYFCSIHVVMKGKLLVEQ